MTDTKHLNESDFLALGETLRNLLLDWKSGKLDEQTVHQKADALWSEIEWPMFPESDPRSILLEVLEQLSILDAQWITIEDIEPMLLFLDSVPGQQEKAWRDWRQYWDRMDWRKRRASIAQNPLMKPWEPTASLEIRVSLSAFAP